jgi:hypothetical protein
MPIVIHLRANLTAKKTIMKLAQVRNEKKNGKIQEKQINYI